ncbi:hypothetical protein TPAR_03079, partial [Tolypocladium paradoxum]
MDAQTTVPSLYSRHKERYPRCDAACMIYLEVAVQYTKMCSISLSKLYARNARHSSQYQIPHVLHHPSNVLHLRVQPIHHVHALLVHGKHNAAAQHQPHQPRQRAAPKRQHALLLEDEGRAARRVAVQRARLGALHARLDRVERLRDEDGH